MPGLAVTVYVLWPAGYSVDAKRTFEVTRWAIRDGCLVLDRTDGTSSVMPLTSIARFDVTP